MRILGILALFGAIACKSDDTGGTGGDINDRDGDGFNQRQDCDDQDPEINPEAEDTVGDDVDNNCDGLDGVDADEDGFASVESGGEDCDDTSAAFNPHQLDIGWDGRDEDCSGEDRHDYEIIGLGRSTTCAVKTTGELSCWGQNTNGEMDGVPGGQGWTALDGGDGFLCGIQSGEIKCWGSDEFGVVSHIPLIADYSGSEWAQVEAGVNHVCAISNVGAGACWGDDEFGQVSGVTELQISQIAPGRSHTCAVLGGVGFATCWGEDGQHQATPNPPNFQYIQMSSGDNYTCAVLEDQTLNCWGEITLGQANPPNRLGPYTDLSASKDSTCGILSSTDIECWGQNNFQQLMAPNFTASTVAMGPTHGCALNALGLMFCWGDNGSGQTDVP